MDCEDCLLTYLEKRGLLKGRGNEGSVSEGSVSEGSVSEGDLEGILECDRECELKEKVRGFYPVALVELALINKYRVLQRLEGRDIGMEEAAREWIQAFSGLFSGLYSSDKRVSWKDVYLKGRSYFSGG